MLLQTMLLNDSGIYSYYIYYHNSDMCVSSYHCHNLRQHEDIACNAKLRLLSYPFCLFPSLNEDVVHFPCRHWILSSNDETMCYCCFQPWKKDNRPSNQSYCLLLSYQFSMQPKDQKYQHHGRIVQYCNNLLLGQRNEW